MQEKLFLTGLGACLFGLAAYVFFRIRSDRVIGREEDFSIIGIRISEGIDESVASLVSDAMNRFEPDHWQIFQPEIYIFYFLQSSNGLDRSRTAKEILEGLRGKNPRLQKMGMGLVSGKLIAGFRRNGEIVGLPLGSAINEADRLALEDREKRLKENVA
jgi:hypothetical protein